MADTPMIPRPADYVCPLDDSYLAMVNQALSLLHTHRYNVQQARLCGLPVDAMEADAQRLHDLLTAIKKHFFPYCQ